MALTRNIALLGHRRWAQSAVITATSEKAAYPAQGLSNLSLSLWGSTVWRSGDGDVSGVTVKLDLGVARLVQSIVLLGCNFSPSCTRAVAFSNNADLSAPVYSEADTAAFDNSQPGLVDDAPPWGIPLICHRAAGPISARYFGITISDPSNADGYLRAAIALVEDLWQPGRNFAANWERGTNFAGEVNLQTTLRTLSLSMKLTVAEERQLLSLNRSFQNTGRLLVIPQPLKPETWQAEVLWGVFGEPTRATVMDQQGKVRLVALNFTEVDE